MPHETFSHLIPKSNPGISISEATEGSMRAGALVLLFCAPTSCLLIAKNDQEKDGVDRFGQTQIKPLGAYLGRCALRRALEGSAVPRAFAHVDCFFALAVLRQSQLQRERRW